MRITKILGLTNQLEVHRILRALVLALSLLSPSLFAQLASPTASPAAPQPAPAVQKPPPSNRWLLVVDISRAMEPRVEGITETAAMLLGSGMNGQIQPGDTVGVWTFNDRLFSGEFPLQEWSPEMSSHIPQRAVVFLREQTYEKTSRLEKALAGIDQIIKGSEYITVMIISDGQEEIHGTPFDIQINAAYRSFKDRKKTPLPVVTLLRADHGKINNFAVAVPPFPMEVPPLPPELTVVRPKAVAKVEKPRPTLPPLIMSGKKPAATNDPAAIPVTTAAAPEPPKATQPAPETRTAPEPAPTIPKPAAPAPAPVKVNSTAEAPKAPAPPASVTAFARESKPSAPNNAPESATRPNVPAQTAIIVPPETGFGRSAMWFAALGLGGAVFGVVLLLRRPRETLSISLITKSFDRDRQD